MKLLATLLLWASCTVAENTPCVAKYCVEQGDVLHVDGVNKLSEDVNMSAPLEGGVGRGLLSRYPIFSVNYLALIASHDVFAFAMLLIIGANWLLLKRGGATHKLLGRIAIYLLMPLSIIPALVIALYVRPMYAEHKSNNFPTPFLVRIIGLYGCSYIACGLHGLVWTWRQRPALARALAAYNGFLTLYWIETTRFIHQELWSGDHEPTSKVFKLSAQMSVITTAFALWEPVNLLILARHGLFSSAGLDATFNAKRHHVLNMTYLTVLALFAPSLFFFHDTYYVWTPRNGFAAAGLSWYYRTAGMCLTTLVPVFVPKLGMYCQHVGAAIAAPGVRAKKAH